MTKKWVLETNGKIAAEWIGDLLYKDPSRPIAAEENGLICTDDYPRARKFGFAAWVCSGVRCKLYEVDIND